jgi:hypothetical protein
VETTVQGGFGAPAPFEARLSHRRLAFAKLR